MTRSLWFSALLGLAVLTAAALGRHLPHLAPGAHNWAEIGNIAAALVEGRGFSDPFGGGTGATAWAPPLPVWLDAAVFMVAGIKTPAAAALCVALTVLFLAGAHTFLVAALTPLGPWARHTASGAFLALVVLLPDNPLIVRSEAALDLLLAGALLWSTLAHLRTPGRHATAGLIAVAVLAPLAHAGLALATGVTLTLLFVRDARAPRCPVAPMLAGAAAVLALGAWTARNAFALGRFIPLKSNGWFELHLTNVASPSGLLRSGTAFRELPYFNQAQFDRYAALGEAPFVATYRAPTLAALRADPAHFLGNIARRAANAFLFCSREDGGGHTRATFSPADTARLARAGELIVFGPASASWLRLDAPPAEAHARLRALQLDEFPRIWTDWVARRDDYYAVHNGWRGLLAGFILAGAPMLALLATALATRGQLPPVVLWSALLAFAMLLPFVLINHSNRHQLPLLLFHAAWFGACAQAWADRRRSAAPPLPSR